ncbi:methyltransferase domain-containing protein [Seiridium cupressi]
MSQPILKFEHDHEGNLQERSVYPDPSIGNQTVADSYGPPPDSDYTRWLGLQSNLPLPSQLLSARSALQAPPSHILSESVPSAGSVSSRSSDSGFWASRIVKPDFARRANDLINESLGRKSGGTSVVEPDSVLGDSGRLYHGYHEGKYLMPNDAAEQDRLDLQHNIYLLLLDGWLHLAPMTTVPKYVLDIATGTGIWAHDFAEKYPESFVIGNDLSAIQPDPRVPNLVFQKDDAESLWVFPAPHPPTTECSFPCEHRILFDYVHLRMVVTCFDDTRNVMRQAFDNMSPGGWIEYQDISFDLQAAQLEGMSIYSIKHACCIRGAATIGRDLLVAKKYKTYLEEIGFVDVQERQMVLPIGPWPRDPKMKDIGHWNLQNTIEGLKAVGWKMLKLAGYSSGEVETIVQETEAYVRDVRHRVYTPVYVVYGRKPLD